MNHPRLLSNYRCLDRVAAMQTSQILNLDHTPENIQHATEGVSALRMCPDPKMPISRDTRMLTIRALIEGRHNKPLLLVRAGSVPDEFLAHPHFCVMEYDVTLSKHYWGRIDPDTKVVEVPATAHPYYLISCRRVIFGPPLEEERMYPVGDGRTYNWVPQYDDGALRIKPFVMLAGLSIITAVANLDTYKAVAVTVSRDDVGHGGRPNLYESYGLKELPPMHMGFDFVDLEVIPNT